MSYKIIQIKEFKITNLEPMGAKEKFWCIDKEQRELLWKKKRRDQNDSGDDWAEKIASEIALFLDLPHAKVDLASYNDERGTITEKFYHDHTSTLIHGNELLSKYDQTYPSALKGRKVEQYTTDFVFQCLVEGKILLPKETISDSIRDGVDLFVGYLMLDSLISNVDRHHKNWGILRQSQRNEGVDNNNLHFIDRVELAPTFDHGSSLSWQLNDEKRELNMQSAEKLVKYYEGAITPFRQEIGGDYLHTRTVFSHALKFRPKAAAFWLKKLKTFSYDQIDEVVSAVPKIRMSDVSKKFVKTILFFNREKLLELE